MVSAHPLAAAPGSKAVNAWAVLGDVHDYLGGPLGMFDLALSVMNLITSFPFELGAARQAARLTSWAVALISDITRIGERKLNGDDDHNTDDGDHTDGIRILVRAFCTTANLVLGLVINIKDATDAGAENGDSGRRIAIVRVIQTILDVASSASGIIGDVIDGGVSTKFQIAPGTLDLTSVMFQVSTTIASANADKWNYLVCPTR